MTMFTVQYKLMMITTISNKLHYRKDFPISLITNAKFIPNNDEVL
jgi:hypothetical protein